MNNAKPVRAQPRANVERVRRLRSRRRTATEDAARSLEELRGSIVAPERERIERLEDRPPVTAESVGLVVPEAVATATTRRQRDLAVALEPTVTDAVTTVARRRPEIYAEALSPMIGSAVRKAIADALAVIMERFHAALERSLTLPPSWPMRRACTARAHWIRR